MNHTELTEVVSQGAQISPLKASAAIHALWQAMAAAIVAGQVVEIENLGTWRRKTFASRTARNIQTGDLFTIPNRNTVRFKWSRELFDSIQTLI